MRLSVPLLMWLWRQTLPVTILATAAVVALAIFIPARLQMRFIEGWGALIILLVIVHSAAMVAMQGRPFSGAAGYLYTRGFSRDRLWVHHMLASAAAVAVVWLAAGLVVWTPLRGWVQGMLGNPFYPGAAWLDAGIVWPPLPLYVLLLAGLHYAWIRRAQPMRERWIGPLLVVGTLVALPLAMFADSPDIVPLWWIPALAMAAAVVLLVTLSWRLHRNMEVGP